MRPKTARRAQSFDRAPRFGPANGNSRPRTASRPAVGASRRPEGTVRIRVAVRPRPFIKEDAELAAMPGSSVDECVFEDAATSSILLKKPYFDSRSFTLDCVLPRTATQARGARCVRMTAAVAIRAFLPRLPPPAHPATSRADRRPCPLPRQPLLLSPLPAPPRHISPPARTQAETYEAVARGVVDDVLRGFNGAPPARPRHVARLLARATWHQ